MRGETDQFEEFQAIVNSRPLNTYDYVYISVGSAYHEPNIHIGGQRPIPNTNWHYQIYPGWLRGFNNVLLIMIDNARISQTIEGLVPILGNNPNVSLVVYEHTYDLEVNRFLADMLERPDASSTKFMICNYAVLKNPLAREARDINDLDEMLRESYADKGILYKWMGYDYLYLIQPVEYHFTRYGPESERSGIVRKRFGLNREVRIGSPAIPYVQSSDKPKKSAKEIMEPVLDITFEGPDPSLGTHYVEPAATMRPRFMPEPIDEPRVESPVRPRIESPVRPSDSYGPAQ